MANVYLRADDLPLLVHVELLEAQGLNGLEPINEGDVRHQLFRGSRLGAREAQVSAHGMHNGAPRRPLRAAAEPITGYGRTAEEGDARSHLVDVR